MESTRPLLLFAWALAASATCAAPQEREPWPRNDALHWARFCGEPGTEDPSVSYARALLQEMRRLEATGLDTQAQWRRLHAQAACDRPPGRGTGAASHPQGSRPGAR